MVAVEHEGRSILGVVLFPALGEWIYASEGKGAWRVSGRQPPRPAKVSRQNRLSDGLFLTSEVASFDSIGRRDVYDSLQAAAWLSRTWGDCYGYFLVATGRAAVMVDPVMNVWDAAAVLPILQEAGGTFTDWQGRATIHSGQGIATNGLVLDEVLAIIRGFR